LLGILQPLTGIFFGLNDGKSPASQLKQHHELDEMPMPTTVPLAI
jgi:hypothetical protein